MHLVKLPSGRFINLDRIVIAEGDLNGAIHFYTQTADDAGEVATGDDGAALLRALEAAAELNVKK